MNKIMIVSLIKVADSIFASQILKDKVFKDAYIRYITKSKNSLVETLFNDLEELLSIEKIVFTFVPKKEDLWEIKQLHPAINITVYSTEEVTGNILEVIDKTSVFTDECSLSSNLWIQNNNINRAYPPVLELLDDMIANKQGSRYFLGFKALTFEGINKLINGDKNDIKTFGFASMIANKLINDTSRISSDDIFIKTINGIEIPFINSSRSIKHKILDNLLRLVSADYSVVGSFYIYGSGQVDVTLRGTGVVNLKEFAEKYDGSGSILRAGYTTDIDSFFSK